MSTMEIASKLMGSPYFKDSIVSTYTNICVCENIKILILVEWIQR